MKIDQINLRIVKWNSDRYPQVFNKQLQYNLLFHKVDGEVSEFFAASTPVDKLDALCDIYFVIIGGMWKLGLTTTEMLTYIQNAVDLPILTFQECESLFVKSFADGFARLIIRVMFEATGMGLDAGKLLRAIEAVCDSNDTKPAVKTDPSVKANIDKGASYVPPTEALKAILAEVRYE